MELHTQFSSGNCDNQSCLQQQLQQVQETMTYQVADCQISVRTVIDKGLFIQASHNSSALKQNLHGCQVRVQYEC